MDPVMKPDTPSPTLGLDARTTVDTVTDTAGRADDPLSSFRSDPVVSVDSVRSSRSHRVLGPPSDS